MDRNKLPRGWEWRFLPDVAELKNGGTPQKSVAAYWSGGIIPFVTAADLTQLYISEGRSKITLSGLHSRRTVVCEPGDVLIGSRTRVGNCSIACSSMGASQDVTRARPKSWCMPEYLCLYIRNVAYQLAFYSQGTSILGITRDVLHSVKIPIPPLAEQRRIVARIEDLTRRAEEVRMLRQEAVTEISSEIFHIRRRLFHSLSLAWPSKPLGRCGRVLGGGTPSRKREDYWNGNIPWIAPKEMKSYRISSSSERITEAALKESSAQLIPVGAVLFVVRGMILARYIPIGIAASPCAINQDMKAIVPSEGILADYLAEMLWGANELLLSMVETAGHGTKKLETSRWSTLAIPIPDTATQRTVTNFLQAFEKKLSEVEHLQREASDALNNFQSALLAKAFRGKL